MLPLDVTSPDSIAAAVEASGPIDVLVNNAGIGAFGAFEATPLDMARDVFETNTFGVMAMTQAVLPGCASGRSGVVVNVTSSATLAPMPLVDLHREQDGHRGLHRIAGLRARGVRRAAKLVEPGYGPTTRFTANTGPRNDGLIPDAYAPFADRVMGAWWEPRS